MPTDPQSYVQVSPDSTGKKVTAVTGQQIGSDGSQSTVETQMVAMADLDGNQTEVDTLSLFWMLQRINETLEQMLDLMTDAYGADFPQSATGRRRRAMGTEKTRAGLRLLQNK